MVVQRKLEISGQIWVKRNKLNGEMFSQLSLGKSYKGKLVINIFYKLTISLNF